MKKGKSKNTRPKTTKSLDKIQLFVSIYIFFTVAHCMNDISSRVFSFYVSSTKKAGVTAAGEYCRWLRVTRELFFFLLIVCVFQKFT